MFEALPVAVTLTDHEGLMKYGNKAFFCLTGQDPSQIIGKSIYSLFDKRVVNTDHDDELTVPLPAGWVESGAWHKPDPLLQVIDNTGQTGVALTELRLRLNDNDYPLRVEVTKLSEFVCFTFTLTCDSCPPGSNRFNLETSPKVLQNEALEEKLAELGQHNRDLSRSNQDLSQYAYAASHDLQEPLRKIRIYSDILIGSPQLSGKEKFIANKINLASERMSHLISDLLNYSKLLKSDAVVEKVNLQEIMKEVMIDFEIKIQEKNAIVNIPELPGIPGVKLQVNQLFYNLLGNALKFTVPGRQPVLEIVVNQIDNSEVRQFIAKPQTDIPYLHIKFTDNGIGFESKDSERIFEVFKRLYPREVYEGAGIGLALCRRIVQNHGGFLYATSKPGIGSTFNIILPTLQPDIKAKKKGQNKDSAPL